MHVSREEIAAFRAFLTAHSRITKQLEAELVLEHQMSLAAFDVLVQLAEAPDRRLRMTELADAVLLSRSGVTRLVERLEVDGLVTRGRADGDGRGVTATLTDAGYARFVDAGATHVRGIAEHFAQRLNPIELSAMSLLCQRLAEDGRP